MTSRVGGGLWIDVVECEHALILVDDRRRDLAVDDLAEQAGHVDSLEQAGQFVQRAHRRHTETGLKASPRAVGGRCRECRHFAICGGNTRVRAQQLTGDPWAEDPGCYLSNDEVGVSGAGQRVQLTPFTGQRKAVAVPVVAG